MLIFSGKEKSFKLEKVEEITEALLLMKLMQNFLIRCAALYVCHIVRVVYFSFLFFLLFFVSQRTNQKIAFCVLTI